MKTCHLCLIRLFFTNIRAGILIKTALILPILIILVGVGIDYAKLQSAHATLKSAIDIATIALAKQPNLQQLTPDELKQKVDQFTASRMATNKDISDYTITASLDGSGIVVTGDVEVDTTFLRYRSVNKMNLQQTAGAMPGSKSVEIALVLDISGSMAFPDGNTRISQLKVAAKKLACKLMGQETTCAEGDTPNPPDILSTNVRMSIVPFSATVNIGKDNLVSSPDWFDTLGQSSIHQEDIDLGAAGLTTLFQLFDQYAAAHEAEYGPPSAAASSKEETEARLAQEGWRGCVRARSGSQGYDLDDTPPGNNPETLWVPYFAPAEPNRSRPRTIYRNDYLELDSPTSLDSRIDWQRDANKYLTAPIPTLNINNDDTVNTAGYGPNFNCPNSEILPLTNSLARIVDRIQSLELAGSTNGPQGLSWGWRVLSPSEPFSQGAAYGQDVMKVIILLSDGLNRVFTPDFPHTLEEGNGHNVTFYSGYGYAGSGIHLGPGDNVQSANDNLNAKMDVVCNNIKADHNGDGKPDITIYTIAFDLEGDRKYMQDCASEPSKFYDTNEINDPVAQINPIDSVFLSIANDLQSIRLVQ